MYFAVLYQEKDPMMAHIVFTTTACNMANRSQPKNPSTARSRLRSYCLLPRPFFDCCCSACSFPETSLISASGPRVMRAKKMLLSFSIFFASWAWSVLNFKHCKVVAYGQLSRIALLQSKLKPYAVPVVMLERSDVDQGQHTIQFATFISLTETKCTQSLLKL